MRWATALCQYRTLGPVKPMSENRTKRAKRSLGAKTRPWLFVFYGVMLALALATAIALGPGARHRERHRDLADFDDLPVGQRVQRAQYLIVRERAVVDHVADLRVHLEDEQHLLGKRVDHAGKRRALDGERACAGY